MDRLSVREIRALVALDTYGPLTLSEIAGALGIPPSSAHTMLTRLQAHDLVDKQDNKYVITEKGRRAIEQVRELLAAKGVN